MIAYTHISNVCKTNLIRRLEMRILFLGMVLFCSSAFAEDQYALVDAVNHQRSGSSFLSFEAGSKDFSNGNVVLHGSVWHQEYPEFKDVKVIVTQQAQKKVIVHKNSISVGDLLYSTHERVFETQNSKIIRKMLISEDRTTMVGLSDDPGPLAISAILAGSAVALCTAKVIYDMYKCDKPKLAIGFGPSGFQCEAGCE